MQIRLDGRVALVTGAAQGIGRAIALALADAGAKVCVSDFVDLTWRDEATKRGFGFFAADLGRRDGAHRLIDDVVAAKGGIDILINTAGGVRGQTGRPIEEVREADWTAIFEANVDSAFWLAQAVAPKMRATGWGRIVTISSGAGLRPSLTGIQAYTAAKHALVGLTKQLSQDLGPHGITCNSVAPGFIRSNPATEKQWESYGPERQARMIEAIHTRRLGRPEDIASAVLFFASAQAAWITGQILSVDGGRS